MSSRSAPESLVPEPVGADTGVLQEGVSELADGATEEQMGGFLTGFNNINNAPIYA